MGHILSTRSKHDPSQEIVYKSMGHTPSTRSKHDPVKATLSTQQKKKPLPRCLSQDTGIETTVFHHQLEEKWPGHPQE